MPWTPDKGWHCSFCGKDFNQRPNPIDNLEWHSCEQRLEYEKKARQKIENRRSQVSPESPPVDYVEQDKKWNEMQTLLRRNRQNGNR